jgi:hypothetical protein
MPGPSEPKCSIRSHPGHELRHQGLVSRTGAPNPILNHQDTKNTKQTEPTSVLTHLVS